MKIYSAVLLISEDDGEGISAISLPASSKEIATDLIEEAKELYGDDIITYAISINQIDAGFGPELPIH